MASSRAEEIAGWEAAERAGVEVRYLPVPQKRQFDEQLIASEAARIVSDAEAFGWLDHRYAEQMHAQIQVLVAMVRAESARALLRATGRSFGCYRCVYCQRWHLAPVESIAV